MDPSPLSADIVAQQLKLWNQLASALEQAQAALLSGDIAGFEQHTEQQRLCCERLLANAGEVNPCRFGNPGVEAMLKDIRKAQKEVRRLTRIHTALLQRAGRSLVIRRNLIARGGLAYAPASFLQSEAPLGRRRG
jgi:flagellar biosynthesis/type III secretory pathway chaperone